MIEQTALVVSKWKYAVPANQVADAAAFTSETELDVMRKRTATKKGIACRFTSRFYFKDASILEYVGEDSYVIDLADEIDGKELQTMISNSFSKFKDQFDFRKLGTVLQNISLPAFDEKKYDLSPVLLLLKS
jgi:hypothetical protein